MSNHNPTQLTLSKTGQRLYNMARKRLETRPNFKFICTDGIRYPDSNGSKGNFIFNTPRCGGDILNLLLEDRVVPEMQDGRITLAIQLKVHIDYIDYLWQGWDYGAKTPEMVQAVLNNLARNNQHNQYNGFRDGYIMFLRFQNTHKIEAKSIFKGDEKARQPRGGLDSIFAIDY